MYDALETGKRGSPLQSARPYGEENQAVGVLSIDTSGGEGGTVPGLLFDKKRLIQALQQLLMSYTRLQDKFTQRRETRKSGSSPCLEDV